MAWIFSIEGVELGGAHPGVLGGFPSCSSHMCTLSSTGTALYMIEKILTSPKDNIFQTVFDTYEYIVLKKFIGNL